MSYKFNIGDGVWFRDGEDVEIGYITDRWSSECHNIYQIDGWAIRNENVLVGVPQDHFKKAIQEDNRIDPVYLGLNVHQRINAKGNLVASGAKYFVGKMMENVKKGYVR